MDGDEAGIETRIVLERVPLVDETAVADYDARPTMALHAAKDTGLRKIDPDVGIDMLPCPLGAERLQRMSPCYLHIGNADRFSLVIMDVLTAHIEHDFEQFVNWIRERDFEEVMLFTQMCSCSRFSRSGVPCEEYNRYWRSKFSILLAHFSSAFSVSS